LSLRILSHGTIFEVHSLATNQTAHIKFSNDGAVLERDVVAGGLAKHHPGGHLGGGPRRGARAACDRRSGT